MGTAALTLKEKISFGNIWTRAEQRVQPIFTWLTLTLIIVAIYRSHEMNPNN